MAIGRLAGGLPSIDGTAYPGAIKEIEPPTFTHAMFEAEALGMAGAMELPLQLEVMEVTLTWQYIPTGAEGIMFDSVTPHLLVLEIDQQTAGANGEPSFEKIKFTMRLTAKESGLGNYAATEAAEPETTHVCHYFKFERDGATILEVDPYAPDGIKVNEGVIRLV